VAVITDNTGTGLASSLYRHKISTRSFVLFPEYYCEVFFFLAHLGRPSRWPLWSHGCSARPPIAAGGWYKHLGGRFPAVLGVARVLPIGPGGAQSGFSTLRYVSRDFRKKKSGSADSPPPRCPPGPGFLSVERGRAA
jgi:hypothetical protein